MSSRSGMLRGILLLVLLLPALAAAESGQASGEGPRQVIDRTVVEVLAVLADRARPSEERRAELEALARQRGVKEQRQEDVEKILALGAAV